MQPAACAGSGVSSPGKNSFGTRRDEHAEARCQSAAHEGDCAAKIRRGAGKDQQSGEWKEETDWHNVVLWRAENLANYLLKGKQVYIEGRLQTRNYEDKEGRKVYVTEVVAEDVILLGGRAGEAAAGSGEQAG